jgi:hypothetical protein
MSPKTFRLKGHFKFIFYDLAVLGKNLFALESFAKEKVKVEFSNPICLEEEYISFA